MIHPKKLGTPLQHLMSLHGNQIYVKREDLIDLALGGNKARKVSYFIDDAQKRQADYIVTYGSVQSNHCRVVAAAASRLGLPCLLILAEENHPPFNNGNYFLYQLFQAEIVWASVERVAETIEEQLAYLRSQGYNPYFIEGGGHGHLGTQAYVDAYHEILEQQSESGVSFDYIFFASGTGTTQAGLAIGNALSGMNEEKIVGISIARKKERGLSVIRESILSYIEHYRLDLNASQVEVNFVDDYVHEGYGTFHSGIIRTIRSVAHKSAVLLDPIYSGKAFYGMCEYIVANDIHDNNILFIHTGGTPLLFYYADQMSKL